MTKVALATEDHRRRWIPLASCLLSLNCSLALCSLALGCSKEKEEQKAPESTVIVPDATSTTDRPAPSLQNAQQNHSAQQNQAADKSQEGARPGANDYACANDSIWQSLELKALQTGALQLPVQGVVLPSPRWKPCEGQDYCQSLDLAPSQQLLALGQDGNTVRMLIADRCGENTSVTIGEPDSPAVVALRGKDMDFEAAALGGDRFLLGGYARHRSETAEDGFVPREYLVTGRGGKFEKIEAARNKLQALPLASASQLVRVKLGEEACTTMFWKLGVEQCDFRTSNTSNFALFGSNLIYVENDRGMKWNVKDGPTTLLPQLDWVFTDGINVAWAVGDELTVSQPRYDLSELKGSPAPGKAGPRPVALGCGRMLSHEQGAWFLRNIEKGTQWRMPESRFEKASLGSVAMDCDSIIFQNGTRILLKGLGELESIPAVTKPTTAPTADATVRSELEPTAPPATASTAEPAAQSPTTKAAVADTVP